MNSCEKSNNFKKGCVPTRYLPSMAYFDTITIPASLGASSPESGAYKNKLVRYEADNGVYIYDGRGIYTELRAPEK